MTTDSPVVIVTGGTGNLGQAVVAEQTARGARVVAFERHGPPALEALAGAAGSGPLHVGVDLDDAASVQAAVAAVRQALGRIDGVAHTVGGFAFAGATASDAALFQRMFALNVLTTVNLLQAALPILREAGRGSVVVVAAGAALRAPSGMAAYAAAKAGLLRLVEGFADELKPSGVRINAVLPSIIDTPQNRADMPKADHAKWVTPQEVAQAIGFLLSDGAAGVTGAALPVTGRV
jgi:NAD(P)-dependent dehydrogenase (short-subunit alcohol dehydrogenase family)